MKWLRIPGIACAAILAMCAVALATPTAQINIPSTDGKGLGEVVVNITNYTRFSSQTDAGTNLYNIGITTGLLPFEALKLEVGVDFVTSGTQSRADAHPFYFNAKLATMEDLGIKGMPALALGIYNAGTYDKPEAGTSTRQNIAYLLAARTLPVLGRISLGGYYGAERALATSGNPQRNNSGMMASWDRAMPEINERLWLGIDYMSGNNANGEISIGASWAFSKQVALLAGVVWFNPFYKLSPADGGMLPGGKPAFTTQLLINLP